MTPPAGRHPAPPLPGGSKRWGGSVTKTTRTDQRMSLGTFQGFKIGD